MNPRVLVQRAERFRPRQPDLAWMVVGAAAITMVATSFLVAPGLGGFFGAALGLVMLTIAIIDGRSYLIPDTLTAAAFALALINAGLGDSDGVLAGIEGALLRGGLLGAFFLALRAVYFWVRGRHGLGLGDVKLAVVAGAWLDWTTIPIALEVAALAALVAIALRQLSRGRPLRATGRLPFGLFFAPAIWVGWLLGATLLAY
jgi:leader peptidase (prepilin peptidase)/N-methyltransferase